MPLLVVVSLLTVVKIKAVRDVMDLNAVVTALATALAYNISFTFTFLLHSQIAYETEQLI